ncbi:PKD domain-containing protein [Chitinophagaceae bacterium LWZ2-11]
MKPTREIKAIVGLIASIFIFSRTNAQTKAYFSSDVNTGCVPLIVQFKDSSTGAAASWRWTLGNGSTSTLQNPAVIYTSPGTYSIKLVVQGAGGSDSLTKVDYIHVYDKPVVNFSASPGAGCVPFPVVFVDHSTPGSGSITKYTWDFGDGNISNDVQPTHIYSVAGNYGVTLTVTNSAGCTVSKQQSPLITASTSKAAYDYSYVNACQTPTTVIFNNKSTATQSISSQWSFGDGGTSTQTSPTHQYNQSGTYNATLIVKSTVGCTDTLTRQIVTGIVQPAFTAPGSACINAPIQFSNSSTPTPVSVTWNFGDGNSDTGINAQHAYAQGGTYNVTMTANFGNCVQSAAKSVSIVQKPIVDFSVQGTGKFCSAPATVSFNNGSANVTAYQWSFGDGSTSSEKNPAHTYTAQGVYTVTLKAFNTTGCYDTISKKDFINIQAPKITGLGGLPYKGCIPSNVKMSAIVTTAEPITSYQWNFGDGTGSSDAAPVHTYTLAGTYDVTLVITTQSGCQDSLHMVSAVMTDTVPHIDFIAAPLSACASTAISFTDHSSNDIRTWLWDFGDKTTSADQNPQHKYSDTGYFTITLVVTNKACSDTLLKQLYVHIDAPVAAFTQGYNCATKYTRTFTDMSIGDFSRVWDFGDGQTDTVKNSIHTYTQTGQYSVILTVTNGTCTDVRKGIVNIIDLNPSFTYIPASGELCKNTSVQFTATNYDPNLVALFYWDYGDGTHSTNAKTNTTASHVYTKTGTYSPYLIASDILACADTVKNLVQLHVYGPSASFGNVAGTCLATANITFSDSSVTDGIHPITNYRWTYGDGTGDSVTVSPVLHKYNAAGNYTVKLVVTDSYGCSDSLTKNNGVIITNPKAVFKLSDSVKCTNNTVVFNSLSTGSPSFAYRWNFGDGTTSSAASPVHNYGAQGQYNVSLAIVDNFGCTDSVFKANALIVSNPKASFTLADTFVVCPPLIISPINTSQSADTYLWDFKDGNASVLANPTHYYTMGGIYNLTLTAKGFGNCYDTAYKVLTVKGPSGSLSYTPLQGCNPLPVLVTAHTQNTVTTIVDFSDGNLFSSRDSIIAHSYTTYGNFAPRLVLTDSTNCKVFVDGKDTIRVAGIKAFAINTIQTGCDSTQVSFKDSSTVYNDKINNYSWSFGDQTSSVAVNPLHYYDSTGTYPIQLVVTTNIGCTDTLKRSINVQVNKSPQLRILAVDSACANTKLSFDVANLLNNNISNWNWNVGTGEVRTTKTINYNYPNAGTYTLTLKAIDVNGCYGTDKHTLTIIGSPNVNAGPDATLCLGASITLQPSGAATYVWNADSTLSCTACTNPIAKPSNATRYYVTGANSFGCTATDDLLINVSMPVHITISGPDTLCAGQSTQLKSLGAQTYSWAPSSYLNNSKIANPIASPPVTTTYTVTGSDSIHCFTDTKQVQIVVYPIPVFHIVDSVLTINVGSTATIHTVSSPDITHWQWSPTVWLSCNDCPQPDVTPKGDLTYRVTASNDGGCSVTDNINIIVVCNGSNLFIPNTFSPNNDGMNDVFYPRGRGVFTIKSFRIFNRWGQEVYEALNFAANDASKGWNGTFNGKPAPADVYVYIVEIVCDNGVMLPSKGNVSLLR